MSHPWSDETCPNAVAVIGMAGRFCAAPDLDAFWHNLCEGVEAARRISAQELAANGCQQAYASHPSFVPVCAQMEDVDKFDAAFFGLSSCEARDMDPQLRLMLETSWHAFENAGYAPQQVENDSTRVGVFAGAAPSSYWLCNVGPDAFNNTGTAFHRAAIVNGQDFLSSWISYKFGFTGPSLNLQTACSTGLVLIAAACQHLLDFSCDIALAATASVINPRGWGYVAESGGILAPDGHCRPFDAAAGGTLPGEGAGAVVLRRLEDAIRDGDRIEAVIRGYGISNDGSRRAGFAAPSADGQALAISLALSMAGLESRDIGYVEAHGTGTYLGDPIEIAGLSKVFQSRPAPCPTGSLKGNLGHLGNAAGMASLLKVILMLRHKHIPPTINFRTLNPALNLDSARFVIAAENMPWDKPPANAPRRAGISSFGFGGTNCHLIVEEAPTRTMAAPALCRERVPHASSLQSAACEEADTALVISAPDQEGLQRCLKTWGEFFLANPDLPLQELAWNMRHTRTLFAWRCVLRCTNLLSAGRALLAQGTAMAPASGADGTRILCAHCPQRPLLVLVVEQSLAAQSPAAQNHAAQNIAEQRLVAQPPGAQQLAQLAAVLAKAAISPLCALVTSTEQVRAAPSSCATLKADAPGTDTSETDTPATDATETHTKTHREMDTLLQTLQTLLPQTLISAPLQRPAPLALPPLLPGTELVLLHVSPQQAGAGEESVRLVAADALRKACCLPEDYSRLPCRAVHLALSPAQPLPCTALMAHLLACGLAPHCACSTGSRPRRLELPLYPFARTSYWLPLRQHGQAETASTQACTCTQEAAHDAGPDSPQPGPDEVVLAIWREAFEQEDLAMDADFYALGGSSMTAVQILADVESVFDIRVSMNQFSGIRTPAQLLALLTRMAEQTQDTERTP